MLQQLDQRSGDGLTVTLSWDDADDVVILHLDDHGRTAVGAVAAELALDAFRHPFLYLTPPEAETDTEAEDAAAHAAMLAEYEAFWAVEDDGTVSS
jgi:hypothetical protein